MRPSIQSPVHGVLPVFATPFHADESIDFDTLEKEIDWLYSQGCHGIVMGMVSETLRLTTDERMQLAEVACRINGKRGFCIISAGSESTRNAVLLAQHAEQVGASAVMVIPPVTVRLSEPELRGYYQTILDSISIPVVVQDASAYVGSPMSIEFQAKLFEDYPERVVFKPEAVPLGPRLSALREATGGRAPVIEGMGGIALVDSFRRGIVGTMPGADLIDALVALWNALHDGDEDRIYALSLPLSSIIAILHSLDAFICVEKYLLHKRGIFPNTVVRKPFSYTLDPETRQEIDRLFARLMRAVEPV